MIEITVFSLTVPFCFMVSVLMLLITILVFSISHSFQQLVAYRYQPAVYKGVSIRKKEHRYMADFRFIADF